MDADIVEQVLEDHLTAPIGEKLKTTLTFLKKLTQTPNDITAADITPMRAVGVTDKAVEEALYVSFLFGMMDRFADAFDFDIPPDQVTKKVGKFLFKRGYKRASVPG